LYTRQQCLQKYGSDYYIKKMISEGKLFKIENDVYSDTATVPELALLSFKYPDAVITMDTAFYIHGLTDVIPQNNDFATDRDAAKIPDKRVHQYFVNHTLFPMGTETMEYRGYEVKIYNKERLLIELIRYKSKLPYDYYKEILLNYRKLVPSLNIQEAQDCAMNAPKSRLIIKILQSEVL